MSNYQRFTDINSFLEIQKKGFKVTQLEKGNNNTITIERETKERIKGKDLLK
tara:strand:+ start:114 stop:269 length:156 start_codon:yes stop_codon:yes gene_type:complete